MAKAPVSSTGLVFRELKSGRFRGVGGRFIPNPVGIKQLQQNAKMQFALRDVAETIAAAAKELAHREAYLTGAYANSIRASSGVQKTEDGSRQAIGRVNAFDYKSAWIEFGSIHNQPPHKILQRAAEAAGYRVSVGRNVRRIIGTGFERVLHLKGK